MDTQDLLLQIFKSLDERLRALDAELREAGARGLSKVRIDVLGQMSLLANRKVSTMLSPGQTADLDAAITNELYVREELKKLLAGQHLELDDDGHLIWIPPNSQYELMISLPLVDVFRLDAESALVSKAVKAPVKNKLLVRRALNSGAFPTLADRILENGGQLEDFL